MHRLDELLVDEGIGTAEVCLGDDDAESYGDQIPLADGIAFARAQGRHLIPSSPFEHADAPSCQVVRLRLPLEWEQGPVDDHPIEPDEDLWFEAHCGGRDLLTHWSCHTFPGRMTAWCPDRSDRYCVSLDEMGEMSVATGYFVRGFLAGNAPDIPVDGEWNTAEEDGVAWESALEAFHREGSWRHHWHTCEDCGRVLLPTNHTGRCAHHAAAPSE